MNTISVRRIEEIIIDCLYREKEVPEDGSVPKGGIITEGITRKFCFHPERLERYRDEIKGFISLLDSTFIMGKGGGGGWTFLNLGLDKDGNQWGEHRNMEELLVLSIGLGMGKIQLDKRFWSSLPGGMPYVGFNPNGFEREVSEDGNK